MKNRLYRTLRHIVLQVEDCLDGHAEVTFSMSPDLQQTVAFTCWWPQGGYVLMQQPIELIEDSPATAVASLRLNIERFPGSRFRGSKE